MKITCLISLQVQREPEFDPSFLSVPFALKRFQSACMSLIVRQRNAEVIIPNVWNIRVSSGTRIFEIFLGIEYLYTSYRHPEKYQSETLVLQPVGDFGKATLKIIEKEMLRNATIFRIYFDIVLRI